jgi:tetratricopeptide (TPR) repeat protein
MTQHDRDYPPPDWYAAGFSRIFWAMPLLALTAGPLLQVGQEQLLLDLLPDFVGYALIASGAGRLMRLHPRARGVRNLALLLNFLSIPLWIQYRRVTGQFGNLTSWVMPLWPLATLVSVLGGAIVWRLCGIIADLARAANVPRTEQSARSRRGLGLIMAVLTLGLVFILHQAPQWLPPALVVYLIAGLIVTCLMMGLMSQAYHLCQKYSFAEEPQWQPVQPGRASRLVALAGIVLPLLLIPAVIWYYNDWQSAWQQVRRHEVKGPENSQIAQRFLDHIHNGRLDEAYDSTTPHFKERMSREDFKGLIRRFDGLKEGPQPGFSEAGISGAWEPGYRGYEDADGRHIRYTLFVRRPEQSFLVRRPPPAGVDEFTIEELDTPAAQRSKKHAQRTRFWNRGIELWNANRFDEAEAACRQSLELTRQLADLTPKDNHYERRFHAWCHYYLGRCLARAGRWKPAEEQFQQAFSHWAKLVRDFPALGASYQQEQWSCHAEWGDLLARAGRVQEADEQFRLAATGLDKWAQDFPDQAPSPLLRACVEEGNHHARQGRFEAADEQFQRVAEVLERLGRDVPGLRPTFQYQLGMIHFDRGYARLLAGRMADAQAELDKARALWKQQASQFQKQKEQYRLALQTHPQETYRLNNLAWFLVTCPDPQFHDPAEAIALAKRALQREPKAGYLWNTLGVAHYRAADFPAALEALQKSLDLQPDNSGNYFFLAMAHWQLGRKAEARQWYEKGVAHMEGKRQSYEELRGDRVEAAFLLGVIATPPKRAKERENRCQFIFPLIGRSGPNYVSSMGRLPRLIGDGLGYHALNRGNNRTISARCFASVETGICLRGS